MPETREIEGYLGRPSTNQTSLRCWDTLVYLPRRFTLTRRDYKSCGQRSVHLLLASSQPLGCRRLTSGCDRTRLRLKASSSQNLRRVLLCLNKITRNLPRRAFCVGGLARSTCATESLPEQ